MKTISFYKLSEKKPNDDQEIWYVHNSSFYGTYEFQCGKVEYSYEEIDDKGNFTGDSYFEKPTDPSIKYIHQYLFDGQSMSDDDLWAPVEEIERDLFEDA